MVSLTELLAVIPVMLVVFGSILGFYNFSVREQDRSDNRVRSLIDQKNGLERMTRELRDAAGVAYVSSVPPVPTDAIDGQLANGRWVRYDCSGTSCRRSEGPSQGVFDQGPVVVVGNVHSAAFQLLADSDTGFQPTVDDPTYVTVSLKVNVKGASNPLALDDGFNLRNVPTEPPAPADPDDEPEV